MTEKNLNSWKDINFSQFFVMPAVLLVYVSVYVSNTQCYVVLFSVLFILLYLVQASFTVWQHLLSDTELIHSSSNKEAGFFIFIRWTVLIFWQMLLIETIYSFIAHCKNDYWCLHAIKSQDDTWSELVFGIILKCKFLNLH